MGATSGLKAIGYSILAVLLWITANLGAAFYVLVVAYIVDFGLHYAQKQEFLQKMTLYLGSTFFAYYLQNSTQFMSIPLLHGLIVAMAAHEVLEVLADLKARLDQYKTAHPTQAAQVDSIEALLPQAQQLAQQLLSLSQVPGGNTPPADVKGEPEP